VKLGGDEARLAFHEGRVVLPGLEKGLLVRFIESEHVHQHDGLASTAIWRSIGKAGSRGRSSDMMGSFFNLVA
jgi:hypothetical protein